MKTSKTRHQFYLDDELSARLEVLTAQPGSSKTAILTEAFRAWLERRAGNELDERFGLRLDRLSRRQELVDQKLDFVAETLGTFIQHQLTLVAHQPPFDRDSAHLGMQRYRSLVETVGRRLGRPEGSPIRTAMAQTTDDKVQLEDGS